MTPSTGTVRSATLGEEIRYRLHLTPGPVAEPRRTLHLLHGRDGSLDDWARALPELDRATAAGRLPPLLVVMPDAPWSDRAGFYVDSDFAGDPPGRAVETALTTDLVRHVDATYPTLADREHRFVGGSSMGGAGAVRFLFGRPDLFAGGIALSPAAYPTAPEGSSVRRSGAFGSGPERFVDAVHDAQAYPAQLAALDPSLPVRLWVVAGDAEDLALPAAELHQRARRVPGVESRLRIHGGDHDFDLWVPALLEGLPFVLGVDS